MRARSVALRLRGEGSNRDGIGARVEVVALGGDGRPARPLVASLRAGEGFLSQGSKWLHFGLGDATTVAQVSVRWPGGEREVFAGIAAGERYLLHQGKGAAIAVARRTEVRWRERALTLPAPSVRTRMWLSLPTPLPALPYADATGAPQMLTGEQRGALLVNLWSQWCAPCRRELAALAAKDAELARRGVGVLALNVDGFGEGGDASAARDAVTAAQRGAPATQRFGALDAFAFGKVELLMRLLLIERGALPLPLSALVDRHGDVRAVYRGELDVDRLLRDVDALGDAGPTTSATLARERARAAVFAGRWLRPPLPHALSDLARGLLENGHDDDARRTYERALRYAPDDAAAHTSLGILCGRRGDADCALRHNRAVLERDPRHLEANFNLANHLARSGQLDAALKHYEAAVEAAPQHRQVRQTYAEALAAAGRQAEARGQFEIAMGLAGDGQAQESAAAAGR